MNKNIQKLLSGAIMVPSLVSMQTFNLSNTALAMEDDIADEIEEEFLSEEIGGAVVTSEQQEEIAKPSYEVKDGWKNEIKESLKSCNGTKRKIAEFLLCDQKSIEGDDMKEAKERLSLNTEIERKTAVTPERQREIAEFFEDFYSFCGCGNPSYKDLLDFCNKILSGGVNFSDKNFASIIEQQKRQAKFFKESFSSFCKRESPSYGDLLDFCAKFFKEHAATPEQQKELAEFFYEKVKKCLDIHGVGPAEEEVLGKEEFKSFCSSGERTYKGLLDFCADFFNKTLKEGAKDILSIYHPILVYWTASVLKEHGIKCRVLQKNMRKYANFAVMYAVNEKSQSDPSIMEENWYVLDIDLMFFSEFKIRSSESKSEDLVSRLTGNLIKSPIDAASIPLVNYADNNVFGFYDASNQVSGDDEDELVGEGKPYFPLCYPLLGEWIDENCTENFKRKYLIMDDVSDEQLRSRKVSKFSRRLLKKSSSKQQSNLVCYYDLVFNRNGCFIRIANFYCLFTSSKVLNGYFNKNLSELISESANSGNPVVMMNLFWKIASEPSV